MALGTITVASSHRGNPEAPRLAVILSFAGDSAYVAGGTAGFAALVQAAVGHAVTPLFVRRIGACGGFDFRYDKANDKLMMFGTGSAEKAPYTEVDNGNKAATTIKLEVVCE